MNKTKVLKTKLTRRTRGQAIRAKCLDCCCDISVEVKNCNSKNCPLWIYRLGYEVDFNNSKVTSRGAE